jgi:hypothetical protein
MKELTKQMLIDAGVRGVADFPDIITRDNIIDRTDVNLYAFIPIVVFAFLSEYQLEEFLAFYMTSDTKFKEDWNLFFDLFENKKSFIDKLVQQIYHC